MRWRDQRQSDNIEDRRGISRGGIGAIGGGLGGILILVLALIFNADPRQLLEQLPAENPSGTQTSRPTNPEEEELKQFSRVVLAQTEDEWNDIFAKLGKRYQEPTLVLFTDEVRSGCGAADGVCDHSIVRVIKNSTWIFRSFRN